MSDRAPPLDILRPALAAASDALADQSLPWPPRGPRDVRAAARVDEPDAVRAISRYDRLETAAGIWRDLDRVQRRIDFGDPDPLLDDLRAAARRARDGLAAQGDWRAPSPNMLRAARMAYRRFVKLMASVMTLDDWQSPAGTTLGHHIYHRQRAPFSARMADAFAHREPAPPGSTRHAFFFGSFMGGFAAWLQALGPAPRTVLADTRLYFECAAALEAAADARGWTIHRIPAQVDALDAALGRHPADVVLLDVAPNHPGTPLADIPRLLAALRARPGPATRHILLDHSLLGPVFDAAAALAEPPAPRDRITLARSLQKFDTAHCDLVSGGYFQVFGAADDPGLDRFAARIREATALLGVGLPAHSAWHIHAPVRPRAVAFRARALRNGHAMAARLNASGQPFTAYPPPCADADAFTGPTAGMGPPLFFIEVGADHTAAWEARLPTLTSTIATGASFGFHETRLGWWAADGRGAIRVALGQEPLDEARALADRLADDLRRWHAAVG